MSDLTAKEVLKLHDELELEASVMLGRSIFAFSRLDANLGLLAATILRFQGKVDQVSKLNDMGFHKRMQLVAEYVRESPGVAPEVRVAMTSWLEDATQVREQRNQLIHGRCAVDPYTRKVLNIVGLPSSEAQHTIEYSLDELESFIRRIQDLQARLPSSLA